jgi:REP element-mobilizing transposase RayT
LRLPRYDYASPGIYFVTMCTSNRRCLFGKVVESEMRLNISGNLVEACWYTLPDHYPHVLLDSFVVMPNHVHGLVVLTRDSEGRQGGPGLSEVIRAFKAFSSRRVNAARGATGTVLWQRGFYDHVVRREESLERIRNYIITNPLRWHLDKENPANARLP